MEKKQLLRSLNIGLIIAVLVVLLSFLISLVPCIKTDGVGVCSLPNPFIDLPQNLPKYYMLTFNPLTGLVIQFLIPLIITILILNSRSKKREPEKVVDYTKKKNHS